MPRTHVFADEAGDFEFARKHGASKYFYLVTVTMDDCEVGHDLVRLRRDLAWNGAELGDYFHASADKQEVRDAVFETIRGHSFKVQATIMEKSKAQLQVRETRPRFYKYGWFYHFKFGTRRALRGADEMMIVTASLGTKKERTAFEYAVKDVLRQTVPHLRYVPNFCPASVDPCLCVVDYCAWAIQRYWESGKRDRRSYDLIAAHIEYEFDLWERGTVHHY